MIAFRLESYRIPDDCDNCRAENGEAIWRLCRSHDLAKCPLVDMDKLEQLARTWGFAAAAMRKNQRAITADVMQRCADELAEMLAEGPHKQKETENA